MSEEKFHFNPRPQVQPTFITSDPNTNAISGKCLDNFNNLLLDFGQMSVENIALKRYLHKIGLWDKFLEYWNWEWEPEKEDF